MVYYKDKLYNLTEAIRDFTSFREANKNRFIKIKEIETKKIITAKVADLTHYSVVRNRKALDL